MPVEVPSTPLTGFVRVSCTVSSGSTVRSPYTTIETVFVVWPAVKVSVTGAAHAL